MDSWRSFQEVFPRFFHGSPEQGSRGAPKATQGVPTASQSAPIASQDVPKASPGLPKDSPRPRPNSATFHGTLRNHEKHIRNGHHESHIKHDHPLACDLWDCSNVVLLSSCLAKSFLSKRFIQTFPPGVPVDVSFLLLHLFRALHEGTLVSTW